MLVGVRHAHISATFDLFGTNSSNPVARSRRSFYGYGVVQRGIQVAEHHTFRCGLQSRNNFHWTAEYLHLRNNGHIQDRFRTGSIMNDINSSTNTQTHPLRAIAARMAICFGSIQASAGDAEGFRDSHRDVFSPISQFQAWDPPDPSNRKYASVDLFIVFHRVLSSQRNVCQLLMRLLYLPIRYDVICSDEVQ